MRKIKFQLKLLNELTLTPFISGNIPQLGNWTVKNAVPMVNEQRTIDGDKELWSYDLSLPTNSNQDNSSISIDYKYFLAPINLSSGIFTNEGFIRTIKKEKIIFDEYGFDGKKYLVDKNCLCKQYEFKLKFVTPPVSFSSKANLAECFVKCDIINMETDKVEVTTPDNIVVTILDGVQDALTNQPKYGVQLSYKDYSVISIRVKVKNPVFCLSLIDKKKLFNNKESTHEIIGQAFINLGHKNVGLIDVPIISLVGHCIGTWPIRYLCIGPVPDSIQNCTTVGLLNSQKNYFGPNKPYFIGHRGSGKTFDNGKIMTNVLENTIDSFENAYSKGIRIIEFDTVLTKEGIPVVYHDYTTCMRIPTETNPKDIQKLRLPLQNLTYSDLEKFDFQLCHDTDINKSTSLYKHNNMFPKLEDLFKMLPDDLSFNIEVKYCMKMKTGNLEDNLCYVEERNIYLDSILEVCFKNVKSRKILFSSFDPDICCMLKAKQSLYPVMFLTQGIGIFSDFKDERTQSIEKAISFAVSESLYGIVAPTNNVLKNLSCIKTVHDKNLFIFTWGNDNNDIEKLKILRDNNVDGIILDAIDIVKDFN